VKISRRTSSGSAWIVTCWSAPPASPRWDAGVRSCCWMGEGSATRVDVRLTMENTRVIIAFTAMMTTRGEYGRRIVGMDSPAPGEDLHRISHQPGSTCKNEPMYAGDILVRIHQRENDELAGESHLAPARGMPGPVGSRGHHTSRASSHSRP